MQKKKEKTKIKCQEHNQSPTMYKSNKTILKSKQRYIIKDKNVKEVNTHILFEH